MIELDTVAIEEFKTYSDYLNKIIMDNNFNTVKDLEDYMNEHLFDWGPSKYLLQGIKRTLDLRNRTERKPLVFYPREFEDEKLKYVDGLNKGSILLLSNPTKEFSTTYCHLNELSLEQIKRYLSLTNTKGENYLISKCRKVGEGRIPRILESIDMYTDQVERQAKLTEDRDINLFTYQQGDKKEIVYDNYQNLIEYLLGNAQELIWGNLSDCQRSLLESSAVRNNKKDRTIKEHVADSIVNYMTLPELEDVSKGEYESVKRFIKK